MRTLLAATVLLAQLVVVVPAAAATIEGDNAERLQAGGRARRHEPRQRAPAVFAACCRFS